MKRFFAIISFAIIAAMLTTAAFAEEAKKEGKGQRPAFEWKDIVIADVKEAPKFFKGTLEEYIEGLKKMDADNDGIVTQAEFGAAMKARFEEMKDKKPEGKPEGRPEGRGPRKGDFKKGEGKKKGEEAEKKECDKSKKGEGKKKGDHKKGEGKKKGEGDEPETKKRERQPRGEWKDIVIADQKNEKFVEFLKKADTNGDGIVTQEEMKAARPARPAAAEGEAKKGPRKGDFKKGEGKKKGDDEAAEKSEGKKREHKKGEGKKGEGKKGEHKKGEGKGKKEKKAE